MRLYRHTHTHNYTIFILYFCEDNTCLYDNITAIKIKIKMKIKIKIKIKIKHISKKIIPVAKVILR